MSLSAIPRPLRELVLARDNGRCGYCHLSQVGQVAKFHIDHIRPRSEGGPTVEENLVLQCPHCSLHKSNKTAAIDPVTSEEVQLFHPLTQRWDDHFRIEVTGECVGVTAAGRATVSALDMNDPRPRVARSLQIRQGLLTPTP